MGRTRQGKSRIGLPGTSVIYNHSFNVMSTFIFHCFTRFWQECNVFAYTYLNLQDQQDGLQRQVDVYSAQLEKLRKTNVYNDAFHIWHDGPFGTINGNF